MSQLTRRHAGFSLIELMVVITLIGIMLAMAAPGFGKWMADGKVRATAESLVNSLRIAQATAVARNRVSMLALTTASPAYNATAAAASGTTNWFVRLIPLSGSDETGSGLGLVDSSTLAKQYSVSLGITGTTAPAAVCFNSLGQLTTQTSTQTGVSAACALAATSGAPWIYWVTSTRAVRKFQVLVYPGGQVRMCDALKTQSNTDPDGCP